MENKRIWRDGQELRCGFTTGSCAATAARAAAYMLLTGRTVDRVEIMTPEGSLFTPEIRQIRRDTDTVSCSVIKDGGDDPDVTTGLYITATVKRLPDDRIEIDGGDGVGRVTRAGLEQPVGAAAINQVPRRMIEENVREILAECRAACGIRVVISVDGGEEAARKTFNPKLGIAGGISILGTSGVVVPMSEKALVETIRVDVKAQIAQGNGYVMAVPGNYGLRFCREQLGLGQEHIVICSNYVGETVDAAVEYGAKGLLLVGHLGKFVKLAAGIMNTHSREADGRMEILAAHAILSGCDADSAAEILSCATTEEAVSVISRCKIRKSVMASLTESAETYLNRRAHGQIRIGIIMYSLSEGFLGESKHAAGLLEKMKEYA